MIEVSILSLFKPAFSGDTRITQEADGGSGALLVKVLFDQWYDNKSTENVVRSVDVVGRTQKATKFHLQRSDIFLSGRDEEILKI
jgi:hypothetical protein